MTEEYVDVFSDKYTKMWKTIAIVKLSIRLLLVITNEGECAQCKWRPGA